MGKKGKRREAEAAPAQSNADFDAMLAEVRADDLPAVGVVSITTTRAPASM